MKLHHIGCLVENIETGIQNYQLLHENVSVSKIYNIDSQKVKVCFVQVDESENSTLIELVQPMDETSSLYKMMNKKGHNFYHLGFMVEDIEAKLEVLSAKGFRMINTFKSEAFDMRKCAFLFSPDMHLIELIEAKS